MSKLSIIIPVLNEGDILENSLKKLQQFQRKGHEIIVVDGNSQDNTVEIAKRFCDQLLVTERGRAVQMNEGARVSNEEILLFLHADCVLPSNADELIKKALSHPKSFWGKFEVSFISDKPIFKIISCLMNIRSRLTKIATGDQGIFITKTMFNRIGGYPKLSLMEDIAISKILKSIHSPAHITNTISTSTRKWELEGITRTIFLMWLTRFRFFIGHKTTELEKFYYGKKF